MRLVYSFIPPFIHPSSPFPISHSPIPHSPILPPTHWPIHTPTNRPYYPPTSSYSHPPSHIPYHPLTRPYNNRQPIPHPLTDPIIHRPALTHTHPPHVRIQEFSSGGGGGGSQGQSDNFYTFFSPKLIWLISKKIIIFQSSRGVQLFQGVQLLIPYRNPYNL